MISKPLISVVLITYNSSKYVLETLESVKAQEYKDLELIISDDCSTDNTLLLCQRWLEKNNNRFARTKLISHKVNTGVAPNYNRGLYHSEGQWIKFIDGDDILLKNCINNNADYVKINRDISFLFSKGFLINENGKIIGRVGCNVKKMNLDVRDQFREMLISSFVFTPSIFVRSETLRSLGGFNEECTMLQDYPLWIKALKNNYKFYYLDKNTILYRRLSYSVTSNFAVTGKKLKKLDSRMRDTLLAISRDDFINELKSHKLYRHYFHALMTRKEIISIKKNKIFLFYFWTLLQYLDPLFTFKNLKDFILRNLKQMIKFLKNYKTNKILNSLLSI